MRKTLHKFLSRSQNKDIYFLHADMWSFPTKGNVINVGIGETNLMNIAAGLMSEGKTVIVYGVAGFILYKSYESLKLNVKGWAENFGSLIIVNAGANGCYSFAGRGHLIDDDFKICDILEIDHYEPETRKEFLRLIKNKCKSKNVSFIRLGFDNGNWS
jgi:transketolase